MVFGVMENNVFLVTHHMKDTKLFIDVYKTLDLKPFPMGDRLETNVLGIFVPRSRRVVLSTFTRGHWSVGLW